MNFYVSLFENAAIKQISRYTKAGPGASGTVMQAIFTLNGQEYMCIDSATAHNFTFTPAISLFVTCQSAEEIERLYEAVV